MNNPLNKTLKLIPLGAALALAVAAGSSYAAPPNGGPADPPAFAGDDADAPPPPEFGERHGPRMHFFRFGGPGFGGPGGEERGGLMHELRRLDLSDAQEDKIDDIKVRHHSEQRALFKRGRELRRSYAALDPLAKDYVSQSGKLADQTAELTRDSLKLRARVNSEIVATLTPEQTQKLQAEWAEKKARHDERREQHGPRGPQAQAQSR